MIDRGGQRLVEVDTRLDMARLNQGELAQDLVVELQSFPAVGSNCWQANNLDLQESVKAHKALSHIGLRMDHLVFRLRILESALE